MSNDSKAAGRLLRSTSTVVLALCSVGTVAYVFLKASSSMQDAEITVLKQFPPENLGQLNAQRDVLLAYAKQYPGFILSGFCMLYVFMQTFAVPGTLSLSVLAGAIYGSLRGLALVTVISTLGSICCFGLSNTIGKGIANAIWPTKVEAFGKEVDKRQNDMLLYIIFLRLTPILPNTFINVASPVVRVPFLPFVIGTLLGCIPNNLVAVSTGKKLGSLKSLSELYNIRQLLLGIVLGTVALLPIYLKRQGKKVKEEKSLLGQEPHLH